MIGPPVMGGELHLGLWEIGPVVGAVALFVWVLLRALSKASAAGPASLRNAA